MPGGDGVDADAIARIGRRSTAYQSFDAGLSGCYCLVIGSADACRSRRDQHRRPGSLGVAQGTDESRQGMEGTDQIGVEAGSKVALGLPMQCAQPNVADAVRERRGQHPMCLGHRENVAFSGHAGAVSDHLQRVVAEAAGQALAIPAGHDQSPA